MAGDFKPGWDPRVALRAEADFLASGARFASASFADDRPRPRAFSLLCMVGWAYDQGPVGSCFANMMAAILQALTGAENQQHNRWEPVNPSRRVIWRRCRELDGSIGGGEGGSIVNSFAAVGPGPKGWGACRESAWPYKPDYRWLEAKPTQEVMSDCQIRIKGIAQLARADFEEMDRLNFSGYPVGLGIWWPFGWDSGKIDGLGRTNGIGSGTYGHAIARIGWFKDWDGHNYSQILNSHGAIYPALPAELAKQVNGYRPTAGSKTHDFWARDDLLADVIGRGYSEQYTGSLSSGFKARVIDTGWRDFM